METVVRAQARAETLLGPVLWAAQEREGWFRAHGRSLLEVRVAQRYADQNPSDRRILRRNLAVRLGRLESGLAVHDAHVRRESAKLARYLGSEAFVREMSSLGPREQLELANRLGIAALQHHTLGSAYAGMVARGMDGRGPLAILRGGLPQDQVLETLQAAKPAMAVAEKAFSLVSTADVSRSVELSIAVLAESDWNEAERFAAKVVRFGGTVARAAVGSLKAINAMRALGLAFDGKAKAGDYLDIAKAGAEASHAIAAMVGRSSVANALKKVAGVLGVFGDLLAVTKVDQSWGERIGNAISLVGSTLMTGGFVGMAVGALVSLVGAIVKWLGGKPELNAVQGLLARAGMYRTEG